jgi:hypothetical protein
MLRSELESFLCTIYSLYTLPLVQSSYSYSYNTMRNHIMARSTHVLASFMRGVGPRECHDSEKATSCR